MLDLSKNIHEKIKKEISGRIISIMFDSCHRWGEDFQGIVIQTYNRLYQWSLVNTPNSKAENFSDIISKVVKEIEKCNGIIVAICTDNAKANKSAFEENDLDLV